MPSIASLIDQSAYPRFRGSITATDVHKHARFGMRIGANETSRVGAVDVGFASETKSVVLNLPARSHFLVRSGHAIVSRAISSPYPRIRAPQRHFEVCTERRARSSCRQRPGRGWLVGRGWFFLQKSGVRLQPPCTNTPIALTPAQRSHINYNSSYAEPR